MSDVSTGVQKAIAHNVCGAPPAKLSKADWKPYALVKKMLQIEQKLVRANAETNGWDVDRGNDGGDGTVLRGGKRPVSITAANCPSLADASLHGPRWSGGPPELVSLGWRRRLRVDCRTA